MRDIVDAKAKALHAKHEAAEAGHVCAYTGVGEKAEHSCLGYCCRVILTQAVIMQKHIPE